jgi:hypothetical protein
MRRTGILLIAAAVHACGGSSTPISPAPPATLPAPPPFSSTVARLVSTLDRDQPIAGAAIHADGLGETTSDAAGYFTLSAPVAAPYHIRVSSSSWVERLTIVKVPSDEATVSLIPNTLSLSYFDEMCRSLGWLLRWSSAPALVVETAVIQYGNRVATDDTVPDDVVERTVREMRQGLPLLTAGRYADYASIEVRRTPAGAPSFAPEGAIALTWQRGLLNGFGHVAYGGRSGGARDGGLSRGEVALDDQWHIFGRPPGSRRDFFLVVQHELGHALGYGHTKTAPSFMYEAVLLTVSALDRQAFEIYMQRPNGNTSPDADPVGVSVNLLGTPGEMLISRCPFLKGPSSP